MSIKKLGNDVSYQKIGQGEYEVHVLIEATSGLSLDEDGSIDVKIGVTSFGNTEYTKVKNDIGVEQTFWGQHFYFTKTFASSNMADNQRLLISVYNYSKFLANSLVGSYEIDLQRIYSEKNHTLSHIWLALSNPGKNFSEIMGYVKISASVLGEKDQNVQLEVEPIASITKEKKVLVPPEIERKTYQVIIDVIRGKNIKPADGKTVDSYLGVEFGQVYSVSETILKNTNPVYKTRIFLPLSLPAVVENLAFRLHDFNFIQKVQVLGSYYLNISELLKSIVTIPNLALNFNNKNNSRNVYKLSDRAPIGDFRWVNFYGPQMHSKRDDQKNVQQFFPDLAPFYVGSVLMRVMIEEDSEPVTKKQELEEEFLTKYDPKNPLLVYYSFDVIITGALNLYNKNRKYKVQIRVGGEQIETDYSQAKNGFCFWNVRKTYTVAVQHQQMVPDIFVYLVDDKNVRVCYKRYTPKEGVILDDQWIRLIPDSAIVNLQNEQAGYLKLGIKMTPTNGREPPKTYSAGSSLGSLYNSNSRSGRLVIDLLCGQSLLPLDDDGSLDPFFVFDYMQSEVVSVVKNDTLNPIYYQRLIIETDIHDEQGCPPIIINAFDKDKLENEFLGSTFIDVEEAKKNGSLVFQMNREPKPFWFNLTQNGLISGRFLATFRLLPRFSGRIPREIDMPKKTYEIILVVLGLRGLKNSGIISVKQPYIEFDFGSLQVYGKNKALTPTEENKQKYIKTQPKGKGRNVNISTVIPSKIVLPQNYLYWPSLSARVKDNILTDFYEPILGYFSISLQDAFTRSKKMREDFKKKKTLLENRTQILEKPARLANISDSLILSLRSFIVRSLNYNWKTLDVSMKDQLNKLSGNPNAKINEDYIVIFPKYQKVITGQTRQSGKATEETTSKQKYVEQNLDLIKGNKEYMQIGFDDNKKRALSLDKRNKHYRFVLNEPYQKYYERAHGVKMGVMDEIPIRVGRVFSSNDLVSNIVRKVSKEDTMAGTYKGELYIKEYNQNRNSGYQEVDQFKKQSMNILNLLTRKGKIHLFLYIIEAANLPQKDTFSHSDPYIALKTGNKTLSFEDEYFEDEPNPQFLKKIHMVLQFPQDSTVELQIWDYDPITADELIGSCFIDIENRLESTLTNSHWNNPIETHNLYNETSKRPQGLIRFWLDLVPMDNISLYREFDIANKPKANYEVRIIVWNVKDMPNNDIEDMSDLYVQCEFNNETQQTDVHYRSSTGEGNFNWRMVFPVTLPLTNPVVTFRCVDKDIITSDDYLASGSFSIGQYLQQAFETDSSVTLFLGTQDLAAESDVKTSKMHIINNKKLYDRFTIPLYNRLQIDRNNNSLNKQGTAEISVQILTEAEAKKKPAGKGRDNPNQHPYLPQPKKRFQFSLNPLKMISQLCGPAFKKQICVALFFFMFIGVIITFGVTFGGSVAGSFVGSRG